MILKLNDLTVACIIGDLPSERVQTQILHVDVELTLDEACCQSDAIADTVDYAVLTERIRTALIEAKCRLIERAAQVVKDVCLAESKVSAVRVKIVKTGAVPNLKSAEIVL